MVVLEVSLLLIRVHFLGETPGSEKVGGARRQDRMGMIQLELERCLLVLLIFFILV